MRVMRMYRTAYLLILISYQVPQHIRSASSSEDLTNLWSVNADVE